MFFPYTHASKTQEFNHKMNVIHVNLETNMEMNDCFHSFNVWMIFKILSF
jgi:hypothetical protein